MMPKVVSILLGVLAGLGVLVVVLGAVAWWGMNTMKGLAHEVYGGPIPKTVFPLAAVCVNQQKMAIFVDSLGENAVILIQRPPVDKKAHAFVPQSVQQAYKDFALAPEYAPLVAGIDQGKPQMLKLIGHQVPTLRFISQGQYKQMGIVNLQRGPLLFVTTSLLDGDRSQSLATFLMEMPAVQNDKGYRTPTNHLQKTAIRPAA